MEENKYIEGMTLTQQLNQMKLLYSIIAVTIGVTFLSFGTTPAEATPIKCSTLAKNFAIGETNFNENIKCKAGSMVMTYGRYCSRTQGIVCTVGRGWS